MPCPDRRYRFLSVRKVLLKMLWNYILIMLFKISDHRHLYFFFIFPGCSRVFQAIGSVRSGSVRNWILFSSEPVLVRLGVRFAPEPVSTRFGADFAMIRKRFRFNMIQFGEVRSLFLSASKPISVWFGGEISVRSDAEPNWVRSDSARFGSIQNRRWFGSEAIMVWLGADFASIRRIIWFGSKPIPLRF